LVSNGAFKLFVSIYLMSLVPSKLDTQSIFKKMNHTQLCGVQGGKYFAIM